MKATGIVRRIDDLGRVVIPKEVRRTLRIREGDPMEIYIGDDGEVVFKKYSPVASLDQFAGDYARSLHKVSGYAVHAGQGPSAARSGRIRGSARADRSGGTGNIAHYRANLGGIRHEKDQY